MVDLEGLCPEPLEEVVRPHSSEMAGHWCLAMLPDLVLVCSPVLSQKLEAWMDRYAVNLSKAFPKGST